MRAFPPPDGAPVRLSACAFVGAIRAVLAASAYGLTIGVAAAVDDWSGSVGAFVTMTLGMALYAWMVGVFFAVPLGAGVGLVLGASLRRRPGATPRGPVVGAALVLVVAAPVVVLLLASGGPTPALVLGAGPAVYGAVAAARMGRSLDRQLERRAALLAERPVSAAG